VTAWLPNPRTPLLWGCDLRDRLRGRPEGPLARWGWFRPPGGPGPLLWVYAPDCQGARVGAEMVRGIRSVRVDVRAVVTAGQGCGETLRPLFQEYPGTAAAPPPAAHARAARRAATRLGARAFLAVHELPSYPFLQGLAAAGVPVSVVNCEPPRRWPRGLHFEHVFPAGEAQAQRWQAAGIPPEPAVDLELFLARTDVEPTLRSLLLPGGHRRLYLSDALPSQDRTAFVDRWCHGERALAVAAEATTSGGEALVPLSRWDESREPLAPGQGVRWDERRWLAAVTASAFAGVLWHGERERLWQALASGLPLVAGPEAMRYLADLGVEPEAAVAATTWAEVEAQWAEWEAHSFAWRDGQARSRRAYWAARRRAEAAMATVDAWADQW